jgi:hypothetical protein
MERVNEDTINEPVYEMLKIINETKRYEIIICTGRSEEAYNKTIKWLSLYNINYTEIFFRPLKNREQDFIVKEKMWRHIDTTYNIVGIYDDRNQVVNHGRKLGLTVFQVSEGDF